MTRMMKGRYRWSPYEKKRLGVKKNSIRTRHKTQAWALTLTLGMARLHGHPHSSLKRIKLK